MCTNNRKLPKYTNPHVHHKQQKITKVYKTTCAQTTERLPKYTNPYVHHKQQKITKIYKSTCAQTIEDYKSICASQTTNKYANPNYMHHKEKD